MARKIGRCYGAAAAILLACCVGATGCGGSGRPAVTGPALPVHRLPGHVLQMLHGAPGARLGKPTWLPASRTLVVVWYPPLLAASPRTDLYTLSLSDGRLSRLPLCRAHCGALSYDFPTALPDGKLGYQRTQFGDADGLGLHGVTLLETTASGRRSRKLVSYGIARGAGGFSYRPGMRDGVADNGEGLYEQLIRLFPDRPRVWPLSLTRVGHAAWSPDGRLLALDGVPSSEHASDLARVDLPRKLYTLAYGGKHLRPLIANLADAGSASWSPDGRWLALRLQPRQGIAGLYLVRVADGRPYLVRRGNDVGSAAWIDNRRLAVSVGVSDTSRPAERGIALLRLPRLPGP